MIFLEISYFYIKLQAMRNSKKKNSRKNKFKIITFKLSARQYDSLKNYSTLEDTTPIKVIKKRLHDCLENYSSEQLGKDDIAKNQLDLFKPLTLEEQQLLLFENEKPS